MTSSSSLEFIRPKKPTLSLDMAPLIDIVFQLLIFFMLSSSYLTPAIKVNLPEAVQHDKNETQHLIVSADSRGNLFVNTEAVAKDHLESVLKERMQSHPEKSVHVRGDAQMPYHIFVEIMDTARKAGARQVNIVHETKNQ